MRAISAYYVIDSDPDPTVEFGGTKDNIPVIRFGSIVGSSAEVFIGGNENLASWLRRFAANLNRFADEVDAREPQ